MPTGTPTRRPGRPSKIDQIARVNDDGTQVTTAEHVIDRVRLGLDISTAADSAGISRNTIHQWRLRGARARAETAQTGNPPTNEDLPYAEFADALERAEADAEAQRLAIIQRVAVGGAVVTKISRKIRRLYDAAGNPVMRDGVHVEAEVERTELSETLRPEWTAAAWYLERRYPHRYARRVELTGAEGTPLIPAAEQAQNIADSLSEYLQGVEDAKTAGAEGA